MTNETKDLLMQYLYRFADHYQISSQGTLPFKKRNELLDQLKVANSEAHKVIHTLFDSFLTEDRIMNDAEKKSKKPDHWNEEFLNAEKKKVEAEMNLVKFCKDHQIPVGGLSVEEYPENKL